MKKALVILLVALVLGGVIGTLVVRDPGYVLVAYDPFTIETSLWFAVLLLVTGYVLLRVVIRLLAGVLHGRSGLREWNARRRARSGRDRTARGWLLLTEGDWKRARKLLEAASTDSPTPVLNHLGAARAAQQLGDTADRDRQLAAAQEIAPERSSAVGLTRAELFAEEGDWGRCLATLEAMQPRHADNPRLLRMQLDCYRELRDWPALLALLPKLQKHAPDPEELARLRRDAWRARLEAAEGPMAVWELVPRELQRDPGVVESGARALLALGRGSEALRITRDALQHEWNPRLVALYGRIPAEDPARQLAHAEDWLKHHPDDPDLLLALGRICLANRLWPKALEYFEASLRRRNGVEVQGELGRLYAALGDRERGTNHLLLALESLPALPQPEKSPSEKQESEKQQPDLPQSGQPEPDQARGA